MPCLSPTITNTQTGVYNNNQCPSPASTGPNHLPCSKLRTQTPLYITSNPIPRIVTLQRITKSSLSRRKPTLFYLYIIRAYERFKLLDLISPHPVQPSHPPRNTLSSNRHPTASRTTHRIDEYRSNFSGAGLNKHLTINSFLRPVINLRVNHTSWNHKVLLYNHEYPAKAHRLCYPDV